MEKNKGGSVFARLVGLDNKEHSAALTVGRLNVVKLVHRPIRRLRWIFFTIITGEQCQVLFSPKVEVLHLGN